MTIDEIKTANRVRGLYFFEPDTMRFFRSRVSDRVYEGPGGVYFVTSERSPYGSRGYSVRFFDRDTGACGTVSGCGFMSYTRRGAHSRAAELARGV